MPKSILVKTQIFGKTLCMQQLKPVNLLVYLSLEDMLKELERF